ncbi:MAG: ABC transporter permease, partial [Candidatus Bipolaricaulota bacterium]
LYATLSALLVAYVGTYLPYGVRPLTSAFEQIHQELEESSRVCGAGFLYTLKRIVVPLLAPGVMSAWMLLACMFVRELSVSVVLSRPGTEVLTVQILELSEDALWGQVAALGLVMVGISSALVIAASLVRSRLARSYLSE